MIRSAQAIPISTILDIDRSIIYEIPKYQREYRWGNEDWEYLFTDLMENDEGYFLGSIICVNKSDGTFDIQRLELIDGQQRITTLSLLYASIYKMFLNKINRDDEEFITTKNNLKHRLVLKEEKGKPRVKLSIQNNNFTDYKYILNVLELYKEPKLKKPKHLGLRRIYKAYNYFFKQIENTDYDGLLRILRKINSALLVNIEVETHADAFTLFESLNNRGIPLTAMDIIKNKILCDLEKNQKRDINEAFEDWVEMINNIQDYTWQERFLRQYYNAFKYKKAINVKGITRATKSKLINIYESLIKKDSEFILDELISKSKIYNSFLEPVDLGKKNKYSEIYCELIDLMHVGAAPSYTLLLYLLSEFNNLADIKKVANFLVKYFVRRNLTDYPGTRDLDNIFIKIINNHDKNNKEVNPEFIINYLTEPDKFADEELFINKLKGDIYVDNKTIARFILSKIEECHQTKEIYTDLWGKPNNGRYEWTIEHIFPKGNNIPKSWIDMVADGDKERAKELQVEWVHKLGNLTLTAYNPNLSNLSFKKKRDRKDNKGNYVGYKNGLFLNEELENLDKWTVDNIKKRTEKLVNEALKLFDVEN